VGPGAAEAAALGAAEAAALGAVRGPSGDGLSISERKGLCETSWDTIAHLFCRIAFRPERRLSSGIRRSMSLRPPAALLLACLLLPGAVPQAQAEETALGPGTTIERLTVGRTTYEHILIRSVTAHSIVFTYAGGMAAVHLRDLPADWQARFHYNPAIDVEAAPAPAPVLPYHQLAAPRKDERFSELLRKFGQPADIKAEVDLRPKFLELNLWVKDQGYRPTCAVFAVLGALEFQNAQLKGKVEKFSEDYLAWATRKTVRRVDVPGVEAGVPVVQEDGDEGFTLAEVVDALRAYGVPLQSSMPKKTGPGPEEDPPAQVIDDARSYNRVFVHFVPGRDAATRINNIICALNAGIPVPIGVGWPNFRSIRGGFLDRQIPMTGMGHAVTLVGYRAANGHLDQADFIFKNSYGATWGQGGYGVATYRYLSHNLEEAVLLEVQAGGAPAHP
jgi:hypothetical protein